jgi:hypothetical protein
MGDAPSLLPSVVVEGYAITEFLRPASTYIRLIRAHFGKKHNIMRCSPSIVSEICRLPKKEMTLDGHEKKISRSHYNPEQL